MNKKAIKLVAILIILYASMWSFNHINPWIGLLIAAVTIYFLTKNLLTNKN